MGLQRFLRDGSGAVLAPIHEKEIDPLALPIPPPPQQVSLEIRYRNPQPLREETMHPQALQSVVTVIALAGVALSVGLRRERTVVTGW